MQCIHPVARKHPTTGGHIRGTLLPTIILIMAALFAATPAPLSAQETGELRGRVLATGTSSPVGSALITIGETGIRGTADSQGRFRIGRVPAGEHTLSVTAIGHEPLERTVTVIGGESVTLSISLDVRPVELGGLSVNVLRPDLQPEGRLEQEQIQEANPRDPGELLREVPGVAAVRRGPLGLDPVVRGLRESEVGSYIDGERRFPAGPARMDSPLTHVDPLAFENVEVAKGPYALT